MEATTILTRRACATRSLCSTRKSWIKGESESAYLIDFHFAASLNWAVIHDLRVEHNDRVAQARRVRIVVASIEPLS